MQHPQSSMSDQQKPMTGLLPQGSTLGSPTGVRLLIAISIGAAFLSFSAITLIQTVIALILAVPFLVISSPITIPAGASLILIATGFLFSGFCFLGAALALLIAYRYVTGNYPFVADKFEYARMKIARDMKEMAKEYGNAVEQG